MPTPQLQVHQHSVLVRRVLTLHIPLPVLPVFKDRVRHPHPWVVLAELREQVVGDEPHSAGQDEEHHAEKRLRERRADLSHCSAWDRAAQE